MGSDAPVVVQSMTNTDTADVSSTVEQVAALARAGSELVRVTVNNDAAAKGVPHIVEQLEKQGVRVPIIGDFHYNGHQLLKKYPDCAKALFDESRRANARTRKPTNPLAAFLGDAKPEDFMKSILSLEVCMSMEATEGARARF